MKQSWKESIVDTGWCKMRETLRVEIDIDTDITHIKGVLKEMRAKLIEIKAVKGVSCVTTWQFNKRRGIWLTYGWGIGKGSTEIWVPLDQGGGGIK